VHHDVPQGQRPSPRLPHDVPVTAVARSFGSWRTTSLTGRVLVPDVRLALDALPAAGPPR